MQSTPKRVGFYSHSVGATPTEKMQPVIEMADAPWHATDKAIVVLHLEKRGKVIQSYRGVHQCPICSESLGEEIMSDGKWMWPSDLAHLLEHHRIELNPAFVEHCLSVFRGETAKK